MLRGSERLLGGSNPLSGGQDLRNHPRGSARRAAQTAYIEVGTEIEIPDSKVKWDKSSPTGHSIVFPPHGYVFCYFQRSVMT
jgi:hypothetical protein